MSHSAGPSYSAEAEVAAVREAWLAAVKAGDVQRLTAIVTDDVVVVHGDGRCVQGREQLKADFLNAFKTFSIEQKVVNPAVTIRGDWAFEIAEMESILTPVGGAVPIRALTTTVVALRRQAGGGWKVARVIGMLIGNEEPSGRGL